VGPSGRTFLHFSTGSKANSSVFPSNFKEMRKTAWIWFVGCVVWFADGAVQLHFHAQAHAELAFMLALLFLVAGLFYRNQKT
jgi:hypothetical protein